MPHITSREFHSHNEQFQKILEALPRIARTAANILIQGESGTGKEMLARKIHQLSPRHARPLLAINCAAIPESLFESELFGHRKGSFTGAISDHKGLFEAAQGGTVFLDEIGDLPLHLQSKILRVLQEKSVRPVGSSFEYKTEFTIISATHKNLKQQISEGRFREDLYYRLTVIPLHIPPLRERRKDIPGLIKAFSKALSQKYSCSREVTFLEDAVLDMTDRPWWGNVRELENFVERSIVLNFDKAFIGKKDLPLLEEPPPTPFKKFDAFPSLSELQESYVQYVLEHVNFHQGKAADILGVSRRTISRKLNQTYSTWKQN